MSEGERERRYMPGIRNKKREKKKDCGTKKIVLKRVKQKRERERERERERVKKMES